FQYFTIPGTRLTAPATLAFSGPKSETLEPKAGKEFHALGLSHNGAVKDAGVVLRDAPKFITGNQRRQHAALIEKMTQAAKRDTLALIFVNDAETAKDGD